ncbi:hypothetical protein [Nitrososphaera sp. AFS]|uniref:hypothetical protein n=1 Tax=Nitrososphaera sp. AFS TaxID=2301191 RepID=UPI00139243FC|nr:hypothetical protein [Nitrososphaera sp. AFS]
MEKYFEGYYCKDYNAVNSISAENSRKVLNTIANSYPSAITQQEISEQAGVLYNSVTNALETLLSSGYIKRDKIERHTSRGRPAKSSEKIQSRGYEYYIENRNFALNQQWAYQLAPGYVKYKPDFLYAWNILVEKEQQNEIYPLLINLLKRVMNKINASNYPILKEIIPITASKRNDGMVHCRDCGLNHEARDFIRAVLLHLLDRLEESRPFIDFMIENNFILKDSNGYNELLNLSPVQEKIKRKEKEQAKQWLENLPQDAKEIVEWILNENPSISTEQIKWRVNKLISEPYFDEQLDDFVPLDLQDALSLIAEEQQASQLPVEVEETVTPSATKIVNIEQTQTKGGIKITLNKVEFAADCVAAFLTVEKTVDDAHDIRFLKHQSKAVQGERQFEATYRGPNYKEIRDTIPHGIREYGAVKFEAVDYDESLTKFEFAFSKYLNNYVFIFEVKIPK